MNIIAYKYESISHFGRNSVGWLRIILLLGGGNLPKAVNSSENSVSVDAGDFIAEFSAGSNLQETYMLFGGEYIDAKNIINSVVLSGVNITDAAEIYASYPDFHLCKSAGAPLAQDRVLQLNLIPADRKTLKELRTLIKKHEENFAKGAERICAAISGKVLSPKSGEFESKESTDKNRVVYGMPDQFHYLIFSAERVECKPLLEKQGNPEKEMGEITTAFLRLISKHDIDNAYAYTTDAFKNDLPRKDLTDFINHFFSKRSFVKQDKTALSYLSGWVETSNGGKRDAILYEYRGLIKFSDESVKDFVAVFVTEKGEWKIQRIDIAAK